MIMLPTAMLCPFCLQSRLLNASEGLLDQSQDMNNLLRVLMHYQEKGNTILTQLHGSSVSLHDVLFYTLALSIPLVFITYPSDIRILLLAGVLTCWGVERAVLQHYVMLFARHHSNTQTAAAAAGKVSVASVSSFTGVHDVKVAVRLVVLGGTLGVVVWLLLKRRAAHNRKEAIFQAIQQSVSLEGGHITCPSACSFLSKIDTDSRISMCPAHSLPSPVVCALTYLDMQLPPLCFVCTTAATSTVPRSSSSIPASTGSTAASTCTHQPHANRPSRTLIGAQRHKARRSRSPSLPTPSCTSRAPHASAAPPAPRSAAASAGSSSRKPAVTTYAWPRQRQRVVVWLYVWTQPAQ